MMQYFSRVGKKWQDCCRAKAAAGLACESKWQKAFGAGASRVRFRSAFLPASGRQCVDGHGRSDEDRSIAPETAPAASLRKICPTLHAAHATMHANAATLDKISSTLSKICASMTEIPARVQRCR